MTNIEKINYIKDTLKLSITELSQLLKVSIKIIYDLYDGIDIPMQLLNKIDLLIEVLNLFIGVDLTKLKTVWNIPLSNISFIQILHNEKDVEIIASKIVELSCRLKAKKNNIARNRINLGIAHLVEFDKYC